MCMWVKGTCEKVGYVFKGCICVLCDGCVYMRMKICVCVYAKSHQKA